MPIAYSDEPPLPPEFIDGGGALSFMDLDLDVCSWSVDLSSFAASPPLFFEASPVVSGGAGIGAPASLLWLFDVEERCGEIADSVVDYKAGFVDGTSDNAHGKSNMMGSLSRCEIVANDEISDESCLIKQRMTQALRYFKDSTDQQVLVQVWAPVKNGNRILLTTSGQPFILDPQSTKLLHYRTVSLTYVFSADEDNDGSLGLPGRVFKRKLPEWTPSVQYYSNNEYQRLYYALQYDVKGTLALPVFDPSGQSCICVVELVMMSQKINYTHEVDKVCKALEAVNLKSSEILDHPHLQISNEGRQTELSEILEILTVVCETQKLPVAQTWIQCKYRTILAHGGGLKKTCSSFDGSCMGQICMSTTNVAYYVIDARMIGFREACVEHHLQRGQGVAGKVFASSRPCFSRDVTRFSKSEYPLVHYAKMFGLTGCLAICLQSSHSGDNYILEFFFPSDCTSPAQQQALLYAIVTLIRQCLHDLKFSTDVNFEEVSRFELVNLMVDNNMKRSHICSQNAEARPNTSTEMTPQEFHDDFINEDDPSQDFHEQSQIPMSETKRHSEEIFHSNSLTNNSHKGPAKRRGKAEKTISLEVLQQYFRGSLKDAAKSLGVCPTTMKRICRQHGISRWPSRKINKVNRSLSDLKCVIESVQGADGTLNLTTLASTLQVTVLPVPLNAEVPAKDENLTVNEGQGIKDWHSNSVNAQQLVLHQIVARAVPDKFSPCLRSASEGSLNTPTSHGSCQGSPINGTFQDSHLAYHDVDPQLNTRCSSEFTSKHTHYVNYLHRNSIGPVALDSQPLGGRANVEDSGSSKDIPNLCASARVICDHVMVPTIGSSKLKAHDSEIVKIKANYKEDIIRFRLACNASVFTLHTEITRRLKLEVGTFVTKYLDDDHEWVMLACDADLEECIEISRASGAHVIRLLVHDLMPNLGSSCESSEDQTSS